jgi:uncharacterized membrane protein
MDEPQAVPSVPIPPPAAVADSGLADNVAGALAYLTFIPAVLFLILEPYNKRHFIRYNAFQCLGLYVCAMVGSMVCAIIPFLGWFVLAPLLGLTILVTFIYCIVKTYSGSKVQLPLISKYAEQFASK